MYDAPKLAFDGGPVDGVRKFHSLAGPGNLAFRCFVAQDALRRGAKAQKKGLDAD